MVSPANWKTLYSQLSMVVPFASLLAFYLMDNISATKINRADKGHPWWIPLPSVKFLEK